MMFPYHRALQLTPLIVTYIFLGSCKFSISPALAPEDILITEYSKLIELDPNYATAHVSLGKAFQDKGQLDDAISQYRKANELDPNNAFVHAYLGKAFQDKGQLDDAIAEYRKANDLDPSNAVTKNNLNILLRWQKSNAAE